MTINLLAINLLDGMRTNNFGEPVSAGMYIYTIHAGDFKQTMKMILLRSKILENKIKGIKFWGLFVYNELISSKKV